jgi:hypothetical protein
MEYHTTISHKSQKGRLIAELGGIKMGEEHQRRFVEELLLPKNSD